MERRFGQERQTLRQRCRNDRFKVSFRAVRASVSTHRRACILVDDIKLTLTRLDDSVVGILASSLARQPWNVDETAVFQAVALSTRDRLLKNWNDTQLHHTQQKVKRAYYLSFEFLVGRQLDNALLNLDVKKPYEDASHKLGFPLEDLIDSERDMGLGNGGLGRLVNLLFS